MSDQGVQDCPVASWAPARPGQAGTGRDPGRFWRIAPVAATLGAATLAALLAWVAWTSWLSHPWTRDGRVRVYVVTITPEVAGRVVELRVRDNQPVRKGDVLMVIDPSDYAIAVSAAEAELEQAMADQQNKTAQAERRQALTTLSTSVEEKQGFASQALMSQAAVGRAQSALARTRVDLDRTRLVSPVNGWVTNLQLREGDYVTVGQRGISLVDADSFWLDGYFEETALERIRDGDPARIHLMGFRQTLSGRVDSVARGIQVDNAEAGPSGLATVNPVFTWVRLAQRVPVRIRFDRVPDGVRLVAGTTATVEIDERSPAADGEGAK